MAQESKNEPQMGSIGAEVLQLLDPSKPEDRELVERFREAHILMLGAMDDWLGRERTIPNRKKRRER